MKVIQIGSNRGNDTLSEHLIENYQELEFGLFVEANSLHISELKKCYSKFKNAYFENIVIQSASYSEQTTKFYLHTHDKPFYAISSCIKEHLIQHERDVPHLQGGKILEFELNCMTINDLFEKYNLINLDWLLIDAEGLDAEILLSLNWNKYQIKRVDFEYLHLKNHKESILKLFESMGYHQIPSLDQHKFDWAFEK